MSDEWNEIGDRSKPTTKERPRPPDARLVCKDFRHEPPEWMAKRKEKNLQAIRAVFEELKEEGRSVTGICLGRKFEFWPGSDTYCEIALDKYFTGIEGFCQRALKAKLQKETQGG